MWRDLPDEDKQEYIKEYEVEKVRIFRSLLAFLKVSLSNTQKDDFLEQMRAYRATPDYINWIRYQRKRGIFKQTKFSVLVRQHQ
jgi:hypothetical protein